MTSLYLIRHADVDYSPDEQRPLSARGQEQAYQLAKLLGGYPIIRIYSSPATRALQTVAPLASKLGVGIQLEPALLERRLGSESDGADFFSMVERTWQDPSFAYSGGESNTVAQQRGIALIQRLIRQQAGKHLVLSTHGNLLTLIMHNYDPQCDYAFWKSLSMPDVYVMCFKNGAVNITRIWQP